MPAWQNWGSHDRTSPARRAAMAPRSPDLTVHSLLVCPADLRVPDHEFFGARAAKFYRSGQPVDRPVPAHHVDRFDKTLQLARSEEHTSELQSRGHLVCRLL